MQNLNHGLRKQNMTDACTLQANCLLTSRIKKPHSAIERLFPDRSPARMLKPTREMHAGTCSCRRKKLCKHASRPTIILGEEKKHETVLCSPRGGAGKYSKRAHASPRRLARHGRRKTGRGSNGYVRAGNETRACSVELAPRLARI